MECSWRNFYRPKRRKSSKQTRCSLSTHTVSHPLRLLIAVRCIVPLATRSGVIRPRLEFSGNRAVDTSHTLRPTGSQNCLQVLWMWSECDGGWSGWDAVGWRVWRVFDETFTGCTGWRKVWSSSHLYDKLGVGVGEALELVLVQVHDEELVGRRQLHRHLRELLVEVADVSARFLPQRDDKRRETVRELVRVDSSAMKRRFRRGSEDKCLIKAQRWKEIHADTFE